MKFWKSMTVLVFDFFFFFFKVEDERNKIVSILREKQDVHEQWSELERKFDKLQHDFGVKEAQYHVLQVRILRTFLAIEMAFPKINSKWRQ